MRGIPQLDAEIPGASWHQLGWFLRSRGPPKRVAVIGAGYIAVELAGEGGRTSGDGGALEW